MSSVFEIASKVLIPGAIAEGKILLAEPVGEYLPFTRAGGGSTTVQNGKVVEQAANWPAIVKRAGECSMVAWRPARPNKLLKTNKYDDPIWQKVQTGSGFVPVVTPNAGIAPDGTATADRIVFDASAASGDRSILRQSVTALSTTGKITFYVKSYDGSTYYISGHTGSTVGDFEVNDEWQRIEFESPATGSLLLGLEVRSGTTSSDMADLLVWDSQAEDVDTYSTDVIPTDASIITRNADSSTTTGLIASGHIGSDSGAIGGVFTAEELIRDAATSSLLLGDPSHGFWTARILSSECRLSFRYNIGSGSETAFTTTQDKNKWLFTWDQSPDINGDRWILSVNGVKVASGPEAFTFPTDELVMSGAGGYWEGAPEIFSQVRLSEAAANAYTTL